jgi:hypothetical protein
MFYVAWNQPCALSSLCATISQLCMCQAREMDRFNTSLEAQDYAFEQVWPQRRQNIILLLLLGHAVGLYGLSVSI